MLNIGGARIAGLLPSWLVRTRGSSGSKTLYLTFDDGPDPQFTLSLCELLEQHAAKATFFCIGSNIREHSDIARTLMERGHFLANHSYNHRAFGELSTAAQIAEANKCHSVIAKLHPGARKVFRAPQGNLSLPLLVGLKTKGWNIVHWSFDSMDYLHKTIAEQLSVFQSRPVANGDIILFHDDNQLAIDTLSEMLPKWKADGFSFNTVEELL